MAIQISLDQTAIANLCQRHRIQTLAIFGSAIRDDFTPNSDVDVLVDFQPGHIPGLAFISIQDELGGLLVRPVDLNTTGFLSAAIRERVRQEATIVYDANR